MFKPLIMKKQVTNAIKKKVFTLLVAFVMVFCSSVKLYALPDRPSSNTKAAEISYKGLQDKLLVFKVDFKNESAQPFELVIKNDFNEIIYSKRFGAKALNTDVYLSDVPETCKLSFIIKTGKKDYSQSFEIDTRTKTVEEYLVKGI